MERALVETTLLSQFVQLLSGVVTLVVGAVVIHLIDRFVFRKLDLEAEIGRGNLAAAVLAGAMWIALAVVFTRG